jgi:hypothetical protein|tara:strand:+ start:730 stop:897 length:168 start_codon:yes stop_codon:yes gene_type:complete
MSDKLIFESMDESEAIEEILLSARANLDNISHPFISIIKVQLDTAMEKLGIGAIA